MRYVLLSVTPAQLVTAGNNRPNVPGSARCDEEFAHGPIVFSEVLKLFEETLLTQRWRSPMQSLAISHLFLCQHDPKFRGRSGNPPPARRKIEFAHKTLAPTRQPPFPEQVSS